MNELRLTAWEDYTEHILADVADMFYYFYKAYCESKHGSVHIVFSSYDQASAYKRLFAGFLFDHGFGHFVVKPMSVEFEKRHAISFDTLKDTLQNSYSKVLVFELRDIDTEEPED